MTCSMCGRPMVPDRRRRATVSKGGRSPLAHRGRGLCSRCYERSDSDTRLDYPRATMDRESFLEDATMLLENGVTTTTLLAERLGISRDALTLRLRRAVRAGDERAERIRNRLLTGASS